MTVLDSAVLDPGTMSLVDQVKDDGRTILFERDGELVDRKSYEQLQAARWKRFDELGAHVSAAFEGVPEEEGMALIQKICDEVRHGAC